MKRNVLITGGNGFIGRNFQKIVLEEKYKEKYNFIFPTKEEFDLLKKDTVFDYARELIYSNCVPDIVIHLAGMVGGVKYNSENQAQSLHDNILMALNILAFCNFISENIEFIGVSSTCVYPFKAKEISSKRGQKFGESDYNLGFEESNYGYALAKSVLVTQVMNYREQFNLDYKIVTPCNMYGEFMDYRERGHFISAAIKKLHDSSKNNKVIFWGTGKEKRQIIYAEDFCRAVLGLIGKEFDNINILDEEQEYTSKEIIDILNKDKKEYEFNGENSGILQKSCSSSLKKYLPDFKFTRFEDWAKKING